MSEEMKKSLGSLENFISSPSNPSCFQTPTQARDAQRDGPTSGLGGGGASGGGSGRGRGDSASRLNFPAPEHLLVSANHKLYRLIKHRRPITRASSPPRGRRNSPPPLPPPSFFFFLPRTFFLPSRSPARGLTLRRLAAGKDRSVTTITHFLASFAIAGDTRTPPSTPPPSPTLGGPRLLPSKLTWTRNYC